jgi:hypothetical protein
VFTTPTERADLTNLNIITFEKKGSLCTLPLGGSATRFWRRLAVIRLSFPKFCRLAGGIFICEMEGLGYDIDKSYFNGKQILEAMHQKWWYFVINFIALFFAHPLFICCS